MYWTDGFRYSSSGSAERFDHGMICPHELFAAFNDHSEETFREAFIGNEDLTSVWDALSKEEWFAKHEYHAALTEMPEKCIPIRMHGDGASNLLITFMLELLGRCCMQLGMLQYRTAN